MSSIMLHARSGPDSKIHLEVPVGQPDTEFEVKVEVRPAPAEKKRAMTAYDLLHSGLVGMWADRIDIGDSRDFARRLREQAQTRRREP